MKRFCFLVFIVAAAVAMSPAHAGVLIEDKFTSPQLAHRDLSPGRGIWKVGEGVATCTQDDALYKKNKDHGPVIWYDAAFTDGTVRFAYKAEKVKLFVFTLNSDKGHVFRFVHSATGLSFRGWPTPGHDAQPVSLLSAGTKTAPLKDGEWVQAELKFEGSRCTVAIGDFKQTLEHTAIGQAKNKLGLGFGFGTLSVRDVSITTP